MDKMRFPIGSFQAKSSMSQEERTQIIDQIAGLCVTLRNTLSEMTNDQLKTPYRPDGWTVQQVVHHMVDNDMNAYLRLKRALTEEEPLSDSYREDLWAELNDYQELPIANSLSLMELLHERLITLLRNLKLEDWKRGLRTRVLGSITVEIALQRFVWHNRHHTAQIQYLKDRMNW